jgi:predicted nuclease with RNAse H fold
MLVRVRTLGIDLASQPKGTGACVVEWADGAAAARLVPSLLDDSALCRLAADADVVAIDAPLGWPDEFVAAVTAYHRGEPWPAGELLSLRYRLTDRTVASMTGVRPLSVSSDLIGVCAFRAARLRSMFPAVEVYPAGALRVWGLPATGYKGVRGAPVRAEIVAGIRHRCPWLAVDQAALLRRDHDLDALLCALVARAVATGRTHRPPPDVAEIAAREGWIHLPTCRLEDLLMED